MPLLHDHKRRLTAAMKSTSTYLFYRNTCSLLFTQLNLKHIHKTHFLHLFKNTLYPTFWKLNTSQSNQKILQQPRLSTWSIQPNSLASLSQKPIGLDLWPIPSWSFLIRAHSPVILQLCLVIVTFTAFKDS